MDMITVLGLLAAGFVSAFPVIRAARTIEADRAAAFERALDELIST